MNKHSSLSRLFFITSATAIALVMAASILVVANIYETKLEKTARDKLELHVYNLLSVSEIKNERLHFPVILFNPEFNREASNLWAMVLDEKMEVIWHSLSITPPFPNITLLSEPGEWTSGSVSINGEKYLTVTFNSVWEDQGHRRYSIVVGENRKVLNKELADYRSNLIYIGLLITGFLLFVQYAALKYSFRPISKLEREISELENGDKDKLSEHYPKELNGVAQNLNALVEKEHRQRSRYRSSMADLAHSIKTPLAILANDLDENSLEAEGTTRKRANDAIKRIDACIEYQLRRAVLSGHTVLNKGSKVEHAFSLVRETLANLYREKKLQLKYELEEELLFYGDQNDLVEILGNLLDNAYKYTHSTIAVSAYRKGDGFELVVEDDGAGIDMETQNQIFKRGERLDTRDLGQGIGLAIVADIVESYGGDITVTSSTMGGAKFVIYFSNKGEAL